MTEKANCTAEAARGRCHMQPGDWERILQHMPATDADQRDTRIRAIATAKAASTKQGETNLLSDFMRGIVHGEDVEPTSPPKGT